MRDSKNMKKVHNVTTYSMAQVPTQCNVQGSALSALVVCVICSDIVVVHWRLPDYLAHCSHFYSVSCLSSFITGEVANEKFWKNHRVLLRTPTLSYPSFSSIRSSKLKKCSWLLAHYSRFYIFSVQLLEK